jgi:hypothetical protein
VDPTAIPCLAALQKSTISKTLVWFEQSAHEPPFEEPSKFKSAMVELVLPIVASVR